MTPLSVLEAQDFKTSKSQREETEQQTEDANTRKGEEIESMAHRELLEQSKGEDVKGRAEVYSTNSKISQASFSESGRGG
jgi:hypothetical protein